MCSIIYSGSFDPFTNGHFSIAQRAAQVFDKVIIAIGDNPAKKSLFTRSERKEMIIDAVKKYKNIEVDKFSGLLVDYAKSRKISLILRVIRSVSDFEYETQMAETNRALNKFVETVLMVSSKETSFLSSKFIKEAIELGGDVSDLVPPSVNKCLKEKFSVGEQDKLDV
ncbi:MAG: pantetheine-phosphate adenylyltransferase [Planctomycetes bacterium]|nr:pantetheine-phosphate adenylyltransferase [Planctomycetota bacterium]